MQDESAIHLYRAAEVHRQAPERAVLQRDLDLFEQGTERHVGGAIDHYPECALIVVFADIGQRSGKVGIGHVGHGDQEVIGKIYALHGFATAILPVLARLPQTRLRGPV